MKFKITYHYLVEGIQFVEAKTRKEAEENHWGEDYGDIEEVQWHKVKKIEKV